MRQALYEVKFTINEFQYVKMLKWVFCCVLLAKCKMWVALIKFDSFLFHPICSQRLRRHKNCVFSESMLLLQGK